MTDEFVFKALDELAANPQFAQAAQRVAAVYHSAPPDGERQPLSFKNPDTGQLNTWLSQAINAGARSLGWVVAQHERDPQAFESVFIQNTADLRQLYESILAAGSVLRPPDTLFGAALAPSLALLSAPQRSQLLYLILQDFVQRTAVQAAGESVLPQYLNWLLSEMPLEFWAGLPNPDLELVRLYPDLLRLGGAGSEAAITEQFGWVLGRGGARRATALVLENLGAALPGAQTLPYLRLCEAALTQAKKPFPPGLRRGGTWEAPRLHQEKGIDEGFLEDSSSVTLDGTDVETTPEAQPRRVQADVEEITPNGVLPQTKAFIAGRPHRLTVWVGDKSETSVSADHRFRDDLLPEGLAHYPLTVVFSEPNHSPQEQVANITLFPEQRNSTKCGFEFIPQPAFPDFRARLEIFYKNQVLQTLLFKGKVLADTALVETADGFKLVVEANLQDAAGNLENVAGRDAYLFVELSGNDLHLKVQMNGERVDRYVPGVNALTQRLIDQLKDLAESPRLYQKLDDPDAVNLLRTLARHGAALHQKLVEQLGAVHPVLAADVRTLQVLTAHEVLLPLELIYNAKSVRSDAGLCAGAQDALEKGFCTCDALAQADAQAGKTICPLRFWGLSRVIERHIIPPELGDQDALPRLNPSSAIPALLLDDVVYGSSSRVLDTDTQALHQAVKASLGQAAYAADWETWSQAVQEKQPSLLLLVPHAEEIDGFLSLEIGVKQFLAVDQITEAYVLGQGAGPAPAALPHPPVALVLGCSTAPLQVPFESCAVYFRRAGAAMTVTTLSPVLGRHVVPVASILLQELRAAQGQVSFGQALLRTRQQALARGYPVVFALVADGNIDWQIA